MNLYTVLVIVLLTTIIVSQLKVLLRNTHHVISGIPVVCLTIVVAALVCWLAEESGYGVVSTPPHLLGKAILVALAASGLYNIKSGSALQNIRDTANLQSETGHPIMKTVLPFIALALTGCAGYSGGGTITVTKPDGAIVTTTINVMGVEVLQDKIMGYEDPTGVKFNLSRKGDAEMAKAVVEAAVAGAVKGAK